MCYIWGLLGSELKRKFNALLNAEGFSVIEELDDLPGKTVLLWFSEAF